MSFRIVFVSYCEKMKLKLDNLIIYKEDKDYLIPLCDISMVIMDDGYTSKLHIL